jgi:DNA-binding transcriptional ArsR family regulator
MSKVAAVLPPIPDVLKALSDEMRWSIVAQMSAVDELACTTLEQTLPVSKPTISYHIKVLYHAGLVEVHKKGRHYYYRLRRDVLESVLGNVASELGATVIVPPRRTGRTAAARGVTTRTPARSTPAPPAAAAHSGGRSRAAASASAAPRSGRATAARPARGSRAARSA